MTITQLRNLVRYNGRDAIATYGDPAITDTLVDVAIQFVANDFNQATQYIKAVTTKTLSSGSANFSITTTGFRPDLLIDVIVGDVTTNNPLSSQPESLTGASWPDLWRERAEDTTTGVPEKFAFQTWSQDSSPNSDGAVWPIPSDAYILNFRWNPPFTTWTVGTSDATTLLTIVNIPDDVLSILAAAMVAKVQFTDPDQLYKTMAWGEYKEYREKMRGKGNFGNKSIRQRSLSEQRLSGRRY